MKGRTERKIDIYESAFINSKEFKMGHALFMGWIWFGWKSIGL